MTEGRTDQALKHAAKSDDAFYIKTASMSLGLSSNWKNGWSLSLCNDQRLGVYDMKIAHCTREPQSLSP